METLLTFLFLIYVNYMTEIVNKKESIHFLLAIEYSGNKYTKKRFYNS